MVGLGFPAWVSGLSYVFDNPYANLLMIDRVIRGLFKLFREFMTVIQAIAILKAAKELAARLLTTELKPPLFPHEGEILIELQKVVDAGLAGESWIYKLAGLDYLEFNALMARLAYHHLRGEDSPAPCPALQFSEN